METTDIADMTRTAIGIGSGRLLTRPSYRQQIDPHLGFGHPQTGCERCTTLNRFYGYGLGVVRNGSWILQNPLFGGYAANRVLPAAEADLDRPRRDIQAERLRLPRQLHQLLANALRQDRRRHRPSQSTADAVIRTRLRSAMTARQRGTREGVDRSVSVR